LCSLELHHFTYGKAEPQKLSETYANTCHQTDEVLEPGLSPGSVSLETPVNVYSLPSMTKEGKAASPHLPELCPVYFALGTVKSTQGTKMNETEAFLNPCSLSFSEIYESLSGFKIMKKKTTHTLKHIQRGVFLLSLLKFSP